MKRFSSIFKKVFAFCCAISTVSLYSISAFATNDSPISSTLKFTASPVSTSINADIDILSEKRLITRETSRPTKYWELRNNPYSGKIEYLTKSTLYTNYYFFPNENGVLFVSYNFRSETGAPVALRIRLYDMYQNKFVNSYESDYVSRGSGVMYFSGLVTNRTYCIAFECDDKISWQTVGLSGDFTILQSFN